MLSNYVFFILIIAGWRVTHLLQKCNTLNIPFDAAVPNSPLYRLAGVDLTSLNELDAIIVHIIPTLIPTLEGLPTFARW